METLFFSLMLLQGAGLIGLLAAVLCAPEGYQDARGFHSGREP